MKRKVLCLLMVCALVLTTVASITVSAEDYVFTDGVYYYHANADGKTAWISSIAADKLVGAVVVPEIAKDNSTGNEYTVTGLYDAFKNQGAKTKEITSLTLPDTITTFKGTATFYDCKGLTSIHLPANLTGDATGTGYLTKTFYFCSQLTSVEIPTGITKFWGTFNSNSAVRTVYLKTTAQADFYQSSGNAEARAWKDNTTGVTIYYPYNGTAPTRTTGYGVTANVVKQDPPSINFTYGDFNYKTNGDLNNTGVTLTSIAADALSGEVTVPEKVTYDQKEYTVTRLDKAFDAREAGDKVANITSLILPDTITQFTCTATFYGCKFSSIHLPENLTGDSMGAGYLDHTFYFCPNLTSVTIPAGITKIYGTFYSFNDKTAPCCKVVHLKSMNQADFYAGSPTADARAWPDDTTGITIYYPKGGTAPTRITGSFTATAMVEPNIFNDGTFSYKENADGQTATLTGVVADSLSGAVTVPSKVKDANQNEYTVTAIGNLAFNGKEAVTSLTLPDTITTIGYQAFMGMKGLTSFVMPNSVTAIDYGLFYGCSNLESVKLSDNLAGLMTSTFAYCSKLKSCIIPEGVTTLSKTFMYCHAIRTVVIPATVTAITGDSQTDPDVGLFSLFKDPESGEFVGAPTEPGFVVYGTSGSKIEEYMTAKGWNFVATDFETPLEIGKPNASSESCDVVVSLANCGDIDTDDGIVVFCAYFDKADRHLIDVALTKVDAVAANSTSDVTVTMGSAYDKENVWIEAFVWTGGNNMPLADNSVLYEVVDPE